VTSKENISWWEDCLGESLSQGDYLQDCPIPIIPSDFSPLPGANMVFEIMNYNVVVMTQSCDLAQGKVRNVVLCPIFTLDIIQANLPEYKSTKAFENVRTGRVDGWYMVAGFDSPLNNSSALIIDFKQVFSLPIDFLSKFGSENGFRKRLKPPFLERMSQAFARFFMRVGLPSDIPSFK
jgi:hypothetical protein